MSEIVFPTQMRSFGKGPFPMSFPNKLDKSLLKYSWRGKDRKLLESLLNF